MEKSLCLQHKIAKVAKTRGNAQYVQSLGPMFNQNVLKTGEMFNMFNMFNPGGKPPASSYCPKTLNILNILNIAPVFKAHFD